MKLRHTTATALTAVPLVLALGATYPAWTSDVPEVRRLAICCAVTLTAIGGIGVLYVMTTVVRVHDDLNCRIRELEEQRLTEAAIGELRDMSGEELARQVRRLSDDHGLNTGYTKEKPADG